MKRFLFFYALIVLTSCSQTKKNEQDNDNLESSKTTNCIKYQFDTPKQQADSLLVYMNNALDINSSNSTQWEQKFFCAFPKTFLEMQAVFGYDDNNGPAPLYDYPIGANMIEFFSNLESISYLDYYDKYVRISINGYWEGDNIREAFGFARRLQNDTEKACKVLSNFTDSEIKSVFYFIFDGPHPENDYNKKIYETLISKIHIEDQRLSMLLSESYAELMAAEHNQIH